MICARFRRIQFVFSFRRVLFYSLVGTQPADHQGQGEVWNTGRHPEPRDLWKNSSKKWLHLVKLKQKDASQTPKPLMFKVTTLKLQPFNQTSPPPWALPVQIVEVSPDARHMPVLHPLTSHGPAKDKNLANLPNNWRVYDSV